MPGIVARRLLAKKASTLPVELTAEDLLAMSIDAVGVKNVLRDIEADCDWLHHLTSSISCPKTIPVFGPGDGCRPQHQKRILSSAVIVEDRAVADHVCY